MFNGTPNQADYVFFDFGGAGIESLYVAWPAQTVHVAGWSPQFPQSNSVMAVINDSSADRHPVGEQPEAEQFGAGGQFDFRRAWAARANGSDAVLLELHANAGVRGGGIGGHGHVRERGVVLRRAAAGGSYTFSQQPDEYVRDGGLHAPGFQR